MDNCKHCGAELPEEDLEVCPACGKSLLPAEEEQTAELTAEEAPAAPVEETPAEEVSAEEAPAEETAAEETAAEEKSAEETVAEEVPAAEEAPAEEPAQKATPGKIALAVVAIVVLVAIIVALLAGGLKSQTPAETTVPTDAMEATEETAPPTSPADTGLDDVTCKGSYTVSNEETVNTKDVVVATVGDSQLTNGMLQVYYWSYVSNYLYSEYGYQAMMYGMLNYAQPLDTQMSMDGRGLTWQQYFLDSALQNWHTHQAMANEARNEGYTITPEIQQMLDAVPTDLETTAQEYGLESVDELLLTNFGAGVTVEDLVNYQAGYYSGVTYYNDTCDAFTATEEEIEEFFNTHETDYANLGVTREDKAVDVRHLLVMPEGATSETIRTETFSDEAWAAAEKEANELLAQWEKGAKTEESFAELANEHSDDGDGTTGGLYTGVTVGQMVEVEEFENWCFDDTRKPGDYGIVKTEFGYHIMYFVDSQLLWPSYAKEDLLAEKETDLILGVMEKYPMEVDYASIAIAEVIMG